MKYIFTFILLCTFASFSFAQRTVQKTTTVVAPQPAKPKGPSPYVLKKDYDSTMIKLNNKIGGLQNSVNAVRGSMNAKDGDINTLQSQMKQVEDVLNSTNFKISLTSDSLSQTRYSMEEIQKGNDQKFAEQSELLKKIGTTTNLLWIVSIIALVLPIVVWFMLSKQIKMLETTLKKNQNEMMAILEENQQNQQKQYQQIDQQIRLESRSAQHFAERLNTAMKDELAGIKNDSEKLESTIRVITSELNELHEKVNSKS